MGYGIQAEGTLPALLAICAEDAMGTSFFFPCCLSAAPWSMAGCDFWVLSATGTLSQEPGGEGKLLFQAVAEQGPVALLLHWGQ